MAIRTPHNVVDDFGKEYIKLAARISRLVEVGIEKGLTASAAVAKAIRILKIRERFSDMVASAVTDGYVIGAGASIPAGLVKNEAIITKRLAKKFNLSSRVWESVKTAREEVTATVSAKLLQQKAWKKIAVDVSEAQLSKGVIAGKVNDLVAASRRVGTTSPEYRKALAKAKRHIAKLAKNDAPTGQLKSAYEDVVLATQKQSAKATAKAVQQAVMQKMRYEAERVVRTETAAAYGAGRYNEMLEDDDVIGVQSVLSSRHEVTDICDFYAEADNFGMGAGVYPKDYAPPYPYHPNCLCILQNVYKGDVKGADDFDPKRGEAWLKRQPKATKQALLGKAGMEKFNDNPASWQKRLHHFGLERKRTVEI